MEPALILWINATCIKSQHYHVQIIQLYLGYVLIIQLCVLIIQLCVLIIQLCVLDIQSYVQVIQPFVQQESILTMSELFLRPLPTFRWISVACVCACACTVVAVAEDPFPKTSGKSNAMNAWQIDGLLLFVVTFISLVII